MINTIMNTWGGLMLAFPETRGEGETFIYSVKQATRAIINTHKINEKWATHPDVMMPKETFDDLITLNDLLLPPVIVAVEYSDRMMFAKMADFYLDKHRYLHDDKAFLPKEKFQLIIKDK